MAAKLRDLFDRSDPVTVKGSLDRPISGLVMDSRRVAPGCVFFALPGLRVDGAAYMEEAVSRGAIAVVTRKLPRQQHGQVTYIQTPDPRAQLARSARRFFGSPDERLEVIGITGTNGKTTVAHLAQHMLAAPAAPVGLIGTIHYDLGKRVTPSFKTTPESLETFGMLAQMGDAGCRRAVMEVSSHGIDQKRVQGLRFAAAVFTNLTRDHLDYHGDMDSYFETKVRLFTGETGSIPALAVINIDDPKGLELRNRIPESVRVVTCGEHPEADYRAQNLTLGFKTTHFTLVTPEGARDVVSPLLGRYNVGNVLAALAVTGGLGAGLDDLLSRLESLPPIPGRMERIPEAAEFNVLVDYAHTDDALRNALGMLRAITPGRLLAVFGCGGNRDRTKRPLMTAAVNEITDFAWATADNPRSEQLDQIFEDMKTGVRSPEKLKFVDDRRRAISLALDAAAPGDSLLIAGKGHESYQEFTDTVIPFDDRQVVRELIAVKRLAPGQEGE